MHLGASRVVKRLLLGQRSPPILNSTVLIRPVRYRRRREYGVDKISGGGFPVGAGDPNHLHVPAGIPVEGGREGAQGLPGVGHAEIPPVGWKRRRLLVLADDEERTPLQRLADVSVPIYFAAANGHEAGTRLHVTGGMGYGRDQRRHRRRQAGFGPGCAAGLLARLESRYQLVPGSIAGVHSIHYQASPQISQTLLTRRR